MFGTMRTIISLILVFFLAGQAFAQDTLFVNKHTFDSPVQNVFEAKGSVFTKTTRSLYQSDGENWKEIPEKYSKPYVFFNETFYESDFIPDSELFDLSTIKELVPQRGMFIATAAREGSRFFVASGSELFEYEIRDHYTRTYHNRSVRDIFIEDSLKVILTYSGIFVNDTIKLSFPEYSNGPLAKIDSSYYLPWDEISFFFPPDSTRLIPDATNQFAGKARKLISWKGEIYALYTHSVARILPGFEPQPIHQGLEYLDLEGVNDGLVFSTYQGLCLKWTEGKIDTLAQLPSKIKDIYPAGNRLILSSDAGAFEVLPDKPTVKLLSDTPNTVMTTLDDFNNLWVATENGLYLVESEHPEPILIIPNVEFNREALLLKDGTLYVGAVDGLYSLDTYEIEKSYLPNHFNTLKVPISERSSTWIVAGILAITGLGLGWLLNTRRKEKGLIGSTPSAKEEWSLEELKQKILDEKIQTIESLASFLDTNTVQLNRNFKKFGTTPGKFLKKIKLEQAKAMIKEGVEMEEISKKIGYSSTFIKRELID